MHDIMKLHKLFLLATVCCTLSACFKDEPANAECDIEKAWIHAENPQDMFYNLSDTLVNVLYTDNLITFDVKPQTDLTAIAPIFQVTPGATVSPASGSVQDFSHGPVTYKVKSEDGQWAREYYVYFNIVTRTETDTIRYDFEDFTINERHYYAWNHTHSRWDTGNGGYAMTGMATKYDPDQGKYVTDSMSFPTIPYADGYDGYAVKLTTQNTGAFGAMMNMRIAAGNLFIGAFDVSMAVTDAMKATRFGEPFDRTPSKFRGYYQYEPGEQYQDENGSTIADKTDQGDIYAVFYRNHNEANETIVLNGDDVKTSPYIVAIAQVTNIVPTNQWTEFEADFVFSEDIDQTLLNNRGYSLAIVFSSSVDGAYFKGAIGSTLLIDKVELICTDIQ